MSTAGKRAPYPRPAFLVNVAALKFGTMRILVKRVEVQGVDKDGLADVVSTDDYGNTARDKAPVSTLASTEAALLEKIRKTVPALPARD